MAIALGGQDTNSRALHQPAGSTLAVVVVLQVDRLSDRHLRLCATLSFDYQNRSVCDDAAAPPFSSKMKWKRDGEQERERVGRLARYLR